MSYYGYITNLKNVRPHPNADRMKLADCFGNTVCVGLDAAEGDAILYFPTDGQLSLDFCLANNLLRKLPDGTPSTGYLECDKRHVRAIRLRGERSDGIALSLESLSTFGDISGLKVGDRIDVFNGHEICCKYVPRTQTRRGHYSEGNKTRKHKVPVAPLFAEHADTEQLAYNLEAFRPGDEIEITLKMHGTSQRTGYLKVLKGFKRTLWDRLFKREGTPIYDWGYVSGTRRTVLENFDGGYYGSNEFREPHSKFFEGKLWKGETCYYEVVGFTTSGAPIMASGNNAKLNDKEFVKQYGNTTVFSYGCSPDGYQKIIEDFDMSGTLDVTDPNVTINGVTAYKKAPQSDVYVYRMTMTTEDGDVVEYTPDFMRYRCEQMGVKCVPVMWKGVIPENPASADDPTISAGEWIKNKAELFYDGPDPVGKTHVREGVVVRILNRPKFAAYKHKNFAFKCLEGLVKAEADAPDIEEAQEVIENDE